MYTATEPESYFLTGQFDDSAFFRRSSVSQWVNSESIPSSNKNFPELDTLPPFDEMIPPTPPSSLGSSSPPSSTITLAPPPSKTSNPSKPHTRSYQRKKDINSSSSPNTQSLKRRIQNRAAQRSFRERQKDYVSQLESQVSSLKSELSSLRDAYSTLHQKTTPPSPNPQISQISQNQRQYANFATAEQWTPSSEEMFSPEMSELEFGNEGDVDAVGVVDGVYEDFFLPFETKGVYDGLFPFLSGAGAQQQGLGMRG